MNKSNSTKKFNELSEEDFEHKIDTVDGEKVYYKTAVTAATSQDFSKLNHSQESFITDCLASADSLIKKYQPNSDIKHYSPKNLDNIIDLWNANQSSFSYSENYFTNVIGVAFGHFLVKTYQMKWAIVTDEYGTDYATTIMTLNFSNFPINSVAKALIQKREGSLEQISLITKNRIAELKKKIAILKIN